MFLNQSVISKANLSIRTLNRALGLVCFFALAFLFLQNSNAGSYSGVVSQMTSESVSIRMSKTALIWRVQIINSSDKNIFNRLTIGDYIAFQGQKIPNQDIVKIQSVDYVGLSRLLGLWKSRTNLDIDSMYCYDFKSFTQVVIYEKQPSQNCVSSLRLSSNVTYRTFKFYINPNQTSWDILVGDKKSYYSGEFQFSMGGELQVKLYDAETGANIVELTLRR